MDIWDGQKIKVIYTIKTNVNRNKIRFIFVVTFKLTCFMFVFS